MNSTEFANFIQSIIEHPHDDNYRLVFADYLEEHGDPRAELIRLQLEIGALPRRSPQRPTLRRKELQLLKTHGSFLPEPPACKVLGRHGGFVNAIEITIPRLLKHQHTIFSGAPITHVTLKGGPTKLAQLAKSPYLERLASVDFAADKVKCVDIATVLAAPALKNLKALKVVLWRESADMKQVHQAIANAKHLELESLEITRSGPLQVYREAEHLRGLKQLSLSWSYGTSVPDNDAAVEEVCEYPVFGRLEEFELFGFGLTRAGMQRLGESAIADKLRRLVIGDARDVQAWDVVFPELEDLTLYHCNNRAFIDVVAKQGKLTALDCTAGQVDDGGAAALAESPLLENLRRIVLTNNQLTLAGATLLAESPHRQRGQKYYLRGNRFSANDVRKLQSKYGSTFGNLGHPMDYNYRYWK